MERVTGFISLDGQFFLSEEDCKSHELLLSKAQILKGRSELIVRYFQSGDPSVLVDLPERLGRCLGGLSDEDKIDAWNQFLMHLFLDGDASLFYEDRSHHVALYEALEIGGTTQSKDPAEYFQSKVELAFEVTSYLLGKE